MYMLSRGTAVCRSNFCGKWLDCKKRHGKGARMQREKRQRIRTNSHERDAMANSRSKRRRELLDPRRALCNARSVDTRSAKRKQATRLFLLAAAGSVMLEEADVAILHHIAARAIRVRIEGYYYARGHSLFALRSALAGRLGCCFRAELLEVFVIVNLRARVQIHYCRLHDDQTQTSAQMKPFSKSVWMVPAACGALQPSCVVEHHNRSFSQSVSFVMEIESRSAGKAHPY